MEVKVIEFKPPNGRRVERFVDVSDKCYHQYKQIVEYGLELTAEELSTGEVSQTISAPALDIDYDITITIDTSYPNCAKDLESMILRFDSGSFESFVGNLIYGDENEEE